MTDPAVRVLVAHPYPDLYGADLMLLRSLAALRARGAAVLLVTPEHGPLLDLVDDAGIEHRVVPVPVLRKSLVSARGLLGLGTGLGGDLRRLRGVLRSWAPDVVYVNTLTLPHWLVAARSRGIASLCHVRELESQSSRTLTRSLTAPLLLATGVVANSQATSTFLAEQHPRLTGRTRVVYNGLAFPDATPAPEEADGRRRRITVVGRLSPRKGQDTAVRAVAELTRAGHDVELELVGSVFPGYEWYERALLDLAAELGVGDRLLLRGFQADVWPFYAGADVVAVPSRLEPFGSVAVEAMAAGRPVVVTDVGGLPEIVTDGVTGTLVPPEDHVALAAALRAVLHDPAAARRVGAAARSSARRRFDLARYEHELVREIHRAAGSVMSGSARTA